MGNKKRRGKDPRELTASLQKGHVQGDDASLEKIEFGTSFDCLPSPVFVRQYEELVPGAAKEILEMAKANNTANIEKEKAETENFRNLIKIASKGQYVLAFLIALLVAAMICAIFRGMEKAAIAIALTIAGLGYFMWKPSAPEKRHKDEEETGK